MTSNLASGNLASGGRPLLWSIVVGCFVASVLASSSPSLPMAWDEGDTILRAQGIARWFTRWSDVEPPADVSPPVDRAISGSPLSPQAIDADWRYTTQIEGHPSLSGLLIALGTVLAPNWLSPLTAARLGPMLFFGLAAGVMCYRLWCDTRCWVVGCTAAAMLLLLPRLFAHAHFATLDGTLTAAWLLAWATFAPARARPGMAVLFGVMLGLTLSAKFTGWLAPLPFAAWTALYRDRPGLRTLAIGVPVALVTFYVLNPPLWHEPWTGLQTFFDLNLHRGARAHHNVSTMFLGRIYNLDHPLPWYNTLVITAITVPLLPLLMAMVGIVSSVRRWRSDHASLLLVLQWSTLMVVRALPFSPPHDAERLFLPSFAFLAALAGVGIGRALYRDTLLTDTRIPAQGWAKAFLALAILNPLVEMYGYAPQYLSYYSRLVGGLRGATALGMEPTYYWDSLDSQAWNWLHEHTEAGDKIAFGNGAARNLELLRRWNTLQRGYLPADEGQYRWYVIQRRPSVWQPWDIWLIDHGRPAYQRTLKGVPLLDVYPYEQYEQAKRATAAPIP